jgi:hypothetical protein
MYAVGLVHNACTDYMASVIQWLLSVNHLQPQANFIMHAAKSVDFYEIISYICVLIEPSVLKIQQ